MILEARAGMQKYFRWDSTSKSPYGIGLKSNFKNVFALL